MRYATSVTEVPRDARRLPRRVVRRHACRTCGRRAASGCRAFLTLLAGIGRFWRPARLHGAAALVATAALLGACREAPATHDDDPAIGEPGAAGAVDWDRRVVSFHAPGWSLAFCEGEGPFLCVARGGEPAGSVELLRLPVRDHDAITAVLARGGGEAEALDSAAAGFAAALAADRRSGMEDGYALRAEPPAEVTVMGKPGQRLVLEGRVGDRVVERIVQYRVVHGDTLYLLAATGADDGGPSDAGGFVTGDLRAFEPVFDRVAAASRIAP